MYKLIEVDPRKVRWTNIRKHRGPEAAKRMGESLRDGQLIPIQIMPEVDGYYPGIDGETRCLGGIGEGLKTLIAIVTDQLLTPEQLADFQFINAVHRADLTAYEKWQHLKAKAEAHPDWTGKDLAAHFKLGESMLTRLMSPSKSIAEVQQALKDRKIGISDCYAISRLPEAEQMGLLCLKLAGASRDQLEDTARKQRNGKKPAVRVSRVKIAMPKATLVISGQEMSMAEVVDLLTETLKEARKAADTFDVRTWVKMMADKARQP